MFTDNVKLDKARIKDVVLAFSPIVVILVLVAALAYHFVDPAPPKHLVISAGDPQGNYYAAALQYKELIKKEGIELEIQTSKGAWENLKRLEDPSSKVEVAFVQDGLGSRQKNPDLTSLGSLFYEPVWVFYRKGARSMNRLVQLRGKRIAIGEHGGETHTMATKLLTASGITADTAKLVEGDDETGASALQAGSVDAAFFIASAEEPMIVKLLKDPKLELMSMDQAEGMTRQFPFLHHLVLPHGTTDLGENLPSHDIDMVGATATLVARNTLHPALTYLLLKAASHVHRRAGIFETKGEFPIDKDYIYPVNEGAKEYFKSGAPFWKKYLPFWLAVLMERFIFLVLPTLAIVIPLLKQIPRFLNWRIRSRIYQGYGELKLLEDRIRPEGTAAEIAEYSHQLDAVEGRINRMNFPVDVFDDVYVLREHIHFVRERLIRMQKKMG